MTKQQAVRRVWAQVRAGLEISIKGEHLWLSQTPAPECDPLSERDAALMDEAAQEILSELRARELAEKKENVNA